MRVPYRKRAGRSARAGKATERFEGARRVDAHAPGFRPPHHPVAIDDERGALLDLPELVPHTPAPSNVTRRPHVAEQPKGQLELARPREIRLGRIGGDADDFGAELVELPRILPEPGELRPSPAGERLGIERDDNELPVFDRLREHERFPMLIA